MSLLHPAHCNVCIHRSVTQSKDYKTYRSCLTLFACWYITCFRLEKSKKKSRMFSLFQPNFISDIGWRGKGFSVMTEVSVRKDGTFLLVLFWRVSRSILLCPSGLPLLKRKEKEPGTRIELPLNSITVNWRLLYNFFSMSRTPLDKQHK